MFIDYWLTYQFCSNNCVLLLAGWFYHAPEPPRKSASAGIPLASQIPGLNDLSSIPIDDAPKPLFRDTGQHLEHYYFFLNCHCSFI